MTGYPNLPVHAYDFTRTPQQNNMQMLLLADAAGTAFVELIVPGVPLGDGVTTAAYRSVVIARMEAIKTLASQKVNNVPVIGRSEVHRTDQAVLDRLLERGLVQPLDLMLRDMPHAPSKLEGDEHRKTRSNFFGRDFSVPRIKQQAGSIEEIVEAALQRLEEIAVNNDGIVDLIGDYAAHLPAGVAAMKLGVPDGMEDQIHHIVSQVFRTQSLESILGFEAMVRSLYQQVDLPEGKIKGYQETVRLGGREAEKVIQVTKQIFAGAYDTGVSLVSSALMHLAMEPEVTQALLQEDVSIAQIREETLRRDAPASTLYSAFLTAPVGLDGRVLNPGEELPANQHLAIGTPIGHGWGAANIDPKAYGEDAQIWDPRRRSGEANVGYGAGAHICPGAALANEMAELAISVLVERYNIEPAWDGWEQGAEPSRVPSPIANQCTSVPVKLTSR